MSCSPKSSIGGGLAYTLGRPKGNTMYWLCYDEPGAAVIIYAAVAPDEYTHEYGYETEAEALAAMREGL